MVIFRIMHQDKLSKNKCKSIQHPEKDAKVCVCVRVCAYLLLLDQFLWLYVGDPNEDTVPVVIKCNSGLIVYESKNLRKVYSLFPPFSSRLSGGSRS